MELVKEIGSYAGFAAVLGLAVLAALYFSQARDVKRLREWAGRAPERDADARSRVAAATNLRQTPAAQAQAGQAAQPAAQTAAASGNSVSPAAVPAASRAPAVAAGAASSGAATAGAGKGPPAGAGARPPGVPSPIRPPQRVSAQTSILAAQEEPRERWYRRLAPRYIALIVAGVLVVGGGVAVGVVQLLGKDSGTGGGSKQGAAAPTDPTSGQKPPTSAPVRPADVSVAVLNATGVNGLASNFGDKAQAFGFKKDNVGNFPGGQQRAESVVLYAPGRQREAKLVRRKFGVNSIEAADQQSHALAPQADVILVVGADKSGG